jgi:hypothetical protein
MSEGRRAPRTRRWLENIFLAAVAAGLAWCGWGLWHDRALSGRFERIRLGMDQAAVEAALGRPDWAGECGARLRSLPRADCASELGYASAFALLRGRYWLVQLDRSGKVVEAEPLDAR